MYDELLAATNFTDDDENSLLLIVSRIKDLSFQAKPELCMCPAATCSSYELRDLYVDDFEIALRYMLLHMFHATMFTAGETIARLARWHNKNFRLFIVYVNQGVSEFQD